MTRRSIIGILGGMGPLATVDLYRKIIEATPAERDQDHLHVIIDADPSIPDRTAALLFGGPDPTPWLLASAQRLEQAGADFIIVPCNTAHAFLPRVRASISIPILSMIAATAERAAEIVTTGSIVGLLATAGTIASRLYQQALEERGLRCIVPDAQSQERVSEAIALVKAGRTDQEVASLVLGASRELIAQGAAALILGCTELPIVFPISEVSVPVLDATRILAETAVRLARGERPLAGLASPLLV
ncbi:aspartate/glutamate racemase family protein [Thermomicrobium sp.]